MGVANVSPPSITYAAPKIPASGMTAESLDLDLAEAIAALLATGSNLRNAYWVMGANLAASMCLFRGSGGSPCYPTMSGPVPTLAGLPVITSGVFETDTGGGTSIVLLDASQITYCEAPAILRTSTHAMVEMSECADRQIVNASRCDDHAIDVPDRVHCALGSTERQLRCSQSGRCAGHHRRAFGRWRIVMDTQNDDAFEAAMGESPSMFACG